MTATSINVLDHTAPGGRRLGLPRLSRLTRRPSTSALLGWVGVTILGIVVVTALLAPLLVSADPGHQDASARLLPPAWETGGTSAHLLGTDNLGRDIFSRIVYGARVTMVVAGLATLLSLVVGTLFGLACGYRAGGWIDTVVMRVIDASMAVPTILLALVVVSALGASQTTLILVIGLSGWVPFTRLIRTEVRSLRHRDFVRAARAIGARESTILRRHILPNVGPTIIVLTTLAFGGNIVFEASLSFLGLGVQPPAVSWGYMINEGRDFVATAWWIALFPGVAITLMVLGVIFTGDWLRDLADPKRKSRRA